MSTTNLNFNLSHIGLILFQFARKEMGRKLNGRKELMDKMIPTNYAVGCRVCHHHIHINQRVMISAKHVSL
jgi:hypothetical protein